MLNKKNAFLKNLYSITLTNSTGYPILSTGITSEVSVWLEWKHWV